MDTYSVYFKETTPDNYHFLGFYQYRSKQEDFTFSFQRETDKLWKDLVILEIGPGGIKKGAIRLKQKFKVIIVTADVEKAVWETSSSPKKG